MSDERPIIVWHRSFHELYMNDAAMSMAGIDPAQIKPGMQIDIEQGHFFEVGLGFAINRLNPWILAPEKYAEGLQRLKQVVHHGGIPASVTWPQDCLISIPKPKLGRATGG